MKSKEAVTHGIICASFHFKNKVWGSKKETLCAEEDVRSLLSTQGGSGGSRHHLNSQSLTVKQDFSLRLLFCGNIGNSRAFWKNIRDY